MYGDPTLLHLAASNDPAIVEKLVDMGEDINSRDAKALPSIWP